MSLAQNAADGSHDLAHGSVYPVDALDADVRLRQHVADPDRPRP